METQTQNKITKDMIISEILVQNQEKAPLLAEIMLDFGIHCIGCGAASFETLEQGVLGHGYSEEDLNKLVESLNKAVGASNEVKETSNQEFKITLTESASNKIKEAMEKAETQNSKLRVSIVGGGCSGFMYNLEITDNHNPSDLHFKQDGLNIGVDRNSLESLNGTEIDFIDTLNESGFKFNNPNATKGCGCGKSFR